jgi:Uroporphyrinogen-III decarboxylase
MGEGIKLVNVNPFEKIFEKDKMCKRERVERTLNLQPVDRVALLDQISYNPGVIELYTGKKINNFDYTASDVGAAICKVMDACFLPVSPLGTDRVTDEYGFVFQNDNWTSWHISRPFKDVEGAREWLLKRIRREEDKKAQFNPGEERKRYHDYMADLQRKVGETVVIDFSIGTGFCSIFDSMGLELYTYFYMDYPDDLEEYMEISTDNAVRKVNAVADAKLSPVVMIAEDFSTKQGPIFSPGFLNKYHFPYLKRLAEAWKSYNIKVLYHSDGNYKKVIPDLMKCGVDGFYCLEPNCGMDIVELKNTWPSMVWAGGVDGVDLLERGIPDEVRLEVQRHILCTGALETGGMFVSSSSEINPTIKSDNFKAVVDATGELFNPGFAI